MENYIEQLSALQAERKEIVEQLSVKEMQLAQMLVAQHEK